MNSIKTTLDEYNTELNIFFLNSKREKDPRSIKKLADSLYLVALGLNPDLLILSDDNAVKYFGEVYGDNLQIPIIFCGLNWDHSDYRLPPGLFTGMLEVLPVRECIEMIRIDYPAIKN